MPEFNVGDTVRLTATQVEMFAANGYNGSLDKGHTGEIIEVIGPPGYTQYRVEGDSETGGLWILGSQLELVVNPDHHKHHDMIIAWAKGATMQFRNLERGTGVWYTASTPSWGEDLEYRVAITPRQENILKLKNMITDLEAELAKLEADEAAG